ncbi:hypothetical protein CPA50_07305 [Marinobacter sp. ANT_B65]|nr:hypothetical protein CPA50_07305 [Marinobacter sp. ANT_B65]
MITSGTTRNILNFMLFQAGWFACIIHPDLLGPLLALALGWLVVFPLLLYIRKSLYPELSQ